MDKGNAPAPEQTVKCNKDYNKEVYAKRIYALTVTFKYLHCKTPRGQFRETAPYLTKLLSKSTEFQMMPEWRHTNGSIHYHGIIRITDYVKWLKQTLPSLKRMGHILVKIIDDEDKWNEYIRKEKHIAEQIVQGFLLPLTTSISFDKQKDLKSCGVMDDYILECSKGNSEECESLKPVELKRH